MPTQAIEDAKVRTRALKTALEEHALPLAKAIDAQRQGRQQPGLALEVAVVALIASLPASLTHYEATEGDVARELDEDGVLRTERDTTHAALRQALSQLATAVEAAWGRDVASRLKLTGRTPDRLEAVLTFASGFLGATSPLPVLPAPHHAWNVPDLAAARAEIAAIFTDLDRGISDVKTDTRQTELARTRRDEAEAAWRQETNVAAELAHAILRYAGRDDLASRILDHPTSTARDPLAPPPANDGATPVTPPSPDA